MARLLAFLVLLAAMLAALAPAWLVTGRAAEASNGWLELTNPQGTLWNGNAEARMPAASSADALALGRVAWRSRIDWSARALVIDLEQTPPAVRPLRLTASAEHRALAGALQIPAAIALRLPPLAGWSIGGTLGVDSDSFAWNGAPTGNARVLWQRASITPSDLSEPIALGDVTARIAADAGGVTLSFANVGGSLQLSGNGDSRTGQVSLLVQPRAETTPALRAWLQTHLAPQPGGGYGLGFTLPRMR